MTDALDAGANRLAGGTVPSGPASGRMFTPKGAIYTPEMLPETPVVRSYDGQMQILDYVAIPADTHRGE